MRARRLLRRSGRCCPSCAGDGEPLAALPGEYSSRRRRHDVDDRRRAARRDSISSASRRLSRHERGSCCDEGHDGPRHAAGDHPAQSRVIPKLDALCDHVLVHTGQNFDAVAQRRVLRGARRARARHRRSVSAPTSFGEQIGADPRRRRARDARRRAPDRLLILGDTNSGLSADRREAARHSRASTWRPAIAASTTACRRR